MNNKIYKLLNGNILPEITVVPTRLSLSTYYPIIGKDYRYTGHSSLNARSPEYTVDTSDGFTTVPAKHARINKRSSDVGYNFITNNCADATRCALESITGKKMNPYFFTTPGDVLDFFKENFDDVRKVKSKNSGKEVYYTNITPKQLEMIREQLLELMLKNRKERHKELLANARKWKHLNGGILLKYLIGGYVLPLNVLEALSNGSAANGILEGFGRIMNKIFPSWMLKVGTYLSPLNYAAALSKGSINPKVGEKVISKWHPNLLLIARTGEAVFGGKAIKNTPKAVVNTAAKAGNKTARAYLISKELNKGIKLNTKNNRIEVIENYFNSPDKWYRVTETPEKFGILELGRNVTTRDASEIRGTVDNWRRGIIKNYEAEDGSHFKIIPGKGNNEGYFIKTSDKHRFSLSKLGAAHGNTSQAAKGQIWGGTFAYSGKFPGGVLEGQAPSKIFRGMTDTGKDSRTNFILQDWNNVPLGARVGFHTGEMPMSNLGWFQRTNKGTYTYEPIIPEKRITIEPSDNWTLNLPGKKDYSITKKPAYSGYTPTKLNLVLPKFVRDVMLGYKWGKNRETKPIGNKDFTELLEGKERIGFGAETSVYEDLNNPSQVLKVYPNGPNGFSTPLTAIQEGLSFIGPLNNRPYNLPTNLEGTVKRHGSYFPVFSQRKVYVPLIMLPKINDFDRSVHGMYSYFGKPDINNILSENDIPQALDFKLENIGLLPDGTVMGIDLWKKGGVL